MLASLLSSNYYISFFSSGTTTLTSGTSSSTVLVLTLTSTISILNSGILLPSAFKSGRAPFSVWLISQPNNIVVVINAIPILMLNIFIRQKERIPLVVRLSEEGCRRRAYRDIFTACPYAVVFFSTVPAVSYSYTVKFMIIFTLCIIEANIFYKIQTTT